MLDPASSLLHVTLGEVLYHRGLNDEALRALERAVELNPDNHDALYLMGFVLGDMGRHEDAQAVTRRAIKLNPTLSRAHANLSIEQTGGAESRDRPLPGRPRRRNAELQVSGEGQLARYNLGLAFRSKGYYAEALREYTDGARARRGARSRAAGDGRDAPAHAKAEGGPRAV